MTLDSTDRQIVAELLVDGRVAVADLAGRVGVSRATAYARLHRLREAGVIRGIHAAVDPAKLGYPLEAIILGDVEQANWRTVRKRLLALPGVERLALTSGGHDFVLIVRAPDLTELRDLVLLKLHDMPDVRTTQTMLVLDDVTLPFRTGAPEGTG
jgi:DNA-binding Lrp family transcriptional regulator